MCYPQELDKKQTNRQKNTDQYIFAWGKNVCVRISPTPQIPDITSLISCMKKCRNNKTSVIEVGKCSLLYTVIN